MGKIHYRDDSVVENAPQYQIDEWRNNKEWGAKCGYVRKNTTTIKGNVTCFYCKKAIARDLKH